MAALGPIIIAHLSTGAGHWTQRDQPRLAINTWPNDTNRKYRISDLCYNREESMALTIRLEDEQGREVDVVFDRRGVLYNLISRTAKPGTNRLRLVDYIDLYENTVFNILQMKQLDDELGALGNAIQNPEEELLLSDMRVLVARCQNGHHLYIKIYGD